MGIEYSLHPKSFEELCDSVRGQVERTRELSMKGEKLQPEEYVDISSESFLATLDRIEQLSEMMQGNTLLFTQINDIFQWIFKYIGLDIEELDESESGEGEEN